MAREATCFSCRHVLLVSAEARDRWLTCPRCLASVGNPNVLLPAEPPATAPETASSPTTPAERASAPITPEAIPSRLPGQANACPWCGQQVDPTWRVCPHCEKPLGARRPAPKGASTDEEVSRDGRGGLVLVGVLGGLLVVGLIVFFCVGGGNLAAASPDGASVLVIGIGVLVAIVVGLIAIMSATKNPTVTAVSGVMGGLALGGGAVLLVVVLCCMAIMAMITNILTCKCH